MFCDERGGIRREAEPVLAIHRYHLYLYHLAEKSEPSLYKIGEKVERSHGKEVARHLMKDVRVVQRNRPVAKNGFWKSYQEAFRDYVKCLPEEDRNRTEGAWMERYGQPEEK